jgi:hypothetical protein
MDYLTKHLVVLFYKSRNTEAYVEKYMNYLNDSKKPFERRS